jgi:hypothetical protein
MSTKPGAGQRNDSIEHSFGLYTNLWWKGRDNYLSEAESPYTEKLFKDEEFPSEVIAQRAIGQCLISSCKKAAKLAPPSVKKTLENLV